MDLITLMTFISLSTVVVVLTTIGSNVSTSCNGLMALISVMAVMAFFLDIIGLPERPGTLT